jgi:hypothetical protein
MLPTVEDLKSSSMVHRFADVWCPPGLTNFLGCVQVDSDVFAIRSLNFPPFACSDTVTASLYVDGRFFLATGTAVSHTWWPDRIVRQAESGDVKLKTTTTLAVGAMACVQRLDVTNRSSSRRNVTLKFALRGGVTRNQNPWNNAIPPTEVDNLIEVDPARNAVRFVARHSQAVCIQGFDRPAVLTPLAATLTLSLASGETASVRYVNAIGGSRADADMLFDSLVHRVDQAIEAARADWNTELESIFTPGNGRYSGHMPLLETSDDDVRRVYLTGILGVTYFRRDSPFSAYGRAYGTLMPRYWETASFLWDYSLSSLVHALLDPVCMKKHLELWMKLDIHQFFGTDWLTGAGLGQWYSVNDFAMTVISHDYLRFSGDAGWLDSSVGDREVLDYLSSYASNYRKFRTRHGLADYGGLNNLLECVDSYLHEVASLNAANVYNLRINADLHEHRGNAALARDMRHEADELLSRVMELYVDGKGTWNARFPDGGMHEVAHVYDFITILNRVGDRLPERVRREMVDFFARELQTPTWMHALSCNDDNAPFSIRPDHQWTGAYTAWPAQAVTGLYRVGEVDRAFAWLKGLSKSANQGPFGQAHIAESVLPPEAGGARKASPEFPWINDWACSSGGAWCNVIIESIFGVQASLKGGLSAKPQFGPFDRDARLRGLAFQGKLVDLDRTGIRRSNY